MFKIFLMIAALGGLINLLGWPVLITGSLTLGIYMVFGGIAIAFTSLIMAIVVAD